MEEQVLDKTYDILRKAIRYLIENRNKESNWGDIRSTALVCWALNDTFSKSCRDIVKINTDIESLIEKSCNWLSKKSRPEPVGISWESEAWDTSQVVLALAPNKIYSKPVDLATEWLRRIIDDKTGSWYEDLWETTLSTVALLRRERFVIGLKWKNTDWLERVFRWFCRIPSLESGEFVCPHYSGFIVWLYNEFVLTQLEKNLIDRKSFESFRIKVSMAEKWLIKIIDSQDIDLWSTYTFSNSYILYALANGPTIHDLNFNKIINWYANQHTDGCFEDIEDTALAVLALGTVVSKKGIPLISIGMDLKGKEKRFKCFLGYCGKSRNIALEIRDFIKKNFQNIEFEEWDFMPGRHLFSEIEAVCNRCHMAIFLLTKDDILMQDNGTPQPTPRDNVVFEIGFFAARYGMNNTILILEKGTKQPTDIGGILYIPLSDRDNLSDVKLRLESKIKSILLDDNQSNIS